LDQREIRMKLTKRQEKIYQYLCLHADEEGQVGRKGVEIAKDLGMQGSAVSIVLDELVGKELVEKRGEGKYKRELWVRFEPAEA
jgi:DNA-binding MarR family transcriptional regulator